MTTQDPFSASVPGALSVRPLGDRAVRVFLGEVDNPETPTHLRRFCAMLALARLPGIKEWTPAYTSVTITYAPEHMGYAALCRTLQQAAEEMAPAPTLLGPIIELPVRYGGMDGPDLPGVAARHGLSVSQVIALHAAPVYEVVLVGFLPGFPYLHGLPPALRTPRLATPRALVPTGSVGIGGAQTGVYPCASPGGWHLIGRTDTPLFDIVRDPPALLQAGNRVRFVPL